MVAQVSAGHSIGLEGLGEHTLDPSMAVSVVTAVDGSRLVRGYGLTDHPNILGGLLAFASLLIVVVPGARRPRRASLGEAPVRRRCPRDPPDLLALGGAGAGGGVRGPGRNAGGAPRRRPRRGPSRHRCRGAGRGRLPALRPGVRAVRPGTLRSVRRHRDRGIAPSASARRSPSPRTRSSSTTRCSASASAACRRRSGTPSRSSTTCTSPRTWSCSTLRPRPARSERCSTSQSS